MKTIIQRILTVISFGIAFVCGAFAAGGSGGGENYDLDHWEQESAWTQNLCTLVSNGGGGVTCNGACYQKAQMREVCKTSTVAGCSPGSVQEFTLSSTKCAMQGWIVHSCGCASSS